MCIPYFSEEFLRMASKSKHRKLKVVAIKPTVYSSPSHEIAAHCQIGLKRLHHLWLFISFGPRKDSSC